MNIPDASDERKYVNNREGVVKQHLESQGWTVQKTGWPDFLCYAPGGQLKAVEVKAFNTDHPTNQQETALFRLGKFFNTEIHYVNNRGSLVCIENYASPHITTQIAKMKSFEGLGVS